MKIPKKPLVVIVTISIILLVLVVVALIKTNNDDSFTPPVDWLNYSFEGVNFYYPEQFKLDPSFNGTNILKSEGNNIESKVSLTIMNLSKNESTLSPSEACYDEVNHFKELESEMPSPNDPYGSNNNQNNSTENVKIKNDGLVGINGIEVCQYDIDPFMNNRSLQSNLFFINSAEGDFIMIVLVGWGNESAQEEIELMKNVVKTIQLDSNFDIQERAFKTSIE